MTVTYMFSASTLFLVELFEVNQRSSTLKFFYTLIMMEYVYMFLSACLLLVVIVCFFSLLFVVVAGHLHFAATGDCWL